MNDSVGIDFGTTNSVMSIYRNGQPEVIPLSSSDSGLSAEWSRLGFADVVPSLYALSKDGKHAMGWEAKTLAMSGRAEEIYEAVKRLFGEANQSESQLRPEEVATMIFSYMKQKAEQENYNPGSAVVTVPANSKALARYKTKIASGMAGIKVSALLNEPTAAAMAYAHKMPFDQTIMVVDWGGGTLDITVLQAYEGVFMELASKGIARNGGIDFDRKIASLISNKLHLADLSKSDMSKMMYEIEKAKIKLCGGDLESVGLVIPQGLGSISYELTKEDFNAATQELIHEVKDPIMQVLKDIKGSASSVDAIVMVGGTSNVPAAREFVQELLPNRPLADGINPMTAISEGAAIAAAILSGEAEDKGFFVATEHALGTLVLDRDLTIAEQKPVRTFVPVIDRNHKLPAKQSIPLSPVLENQESVMIEVLEGELGLKEDDEKVVSYPIDEAHSVIHFDMDQPFEQRGFELTYEYDTDGLIYVSASNIESGKEVLPRFAVTTGIADNPKDLAQMSKRAKSLAGEAISSESDVDSSNEEDTETVLPESEYPSELVDSIKTIHIKIIPFLEEEERAKVVAELDEKDDEAKLAAKVDSILNEYSYLL